jgi:hypothetical protein
VPVAVNCWVLPTVTETFAGVIAKDARVRGAVLDVLLPHPAKLKHTVRAMKNAILRPI